MTIVDEQLWAELSKADLPLHSWQWGKDLAEWDGREGLKQQERDEHDISFLFFFLLKAMVLLAGFAAWSQGR